MRLELAHFKYECRLLSVLLATCLIFNMLDPAILILNEEATVVAKIAGLTGHAPLFAAAFIVLACLVMPYVLMQIFNPNTECRATVIRIACAALCVGGVVWVYLAYLSRNLDYDTIVGIFCRNGFWNIGMAAVLAYHLNNKQLREEEKRVAL